MKAKKVTYLEIVVDYAKSDVVYAYDLSGKPKKYAISYKDYANAIENKRQETGKFRVNVNKLLTVNTPGVREA